MKLKKAIWIITSTNAREIALTAFTKRLAEETARARGYDVALVETVEEYTTRTRRRIY